MFNALNTLNRILKYTIYAPLARKSQNSSYEVIDINSYSPLTHDRPNYVSSLINDDKSQCMLPIKITLRENIIEDTVLNHFPGNYLIHSKKEDNKLYYWFRIVVGQYAFYDDLKLIYDKEKTLLHFTSSSRVGYSDLGTNKQRINRLDKSFKRQVQFISC